MSQRASGVTTQTSYGEMSGELSRHRQRVEVFRGPQNLEDNVVSSSDGLIVATLVIHRRQGWAVGRERPQVACWLWITNRRGWQDMGLNPNLVWAMAAVGLFGLVRWRTTFSLSAAAVSRFSHHQMPRFERPSIRNDETGTNRPSLNVEARSV